MNICVFDTETTSLSKPFCYNIGLVIANTETGEILAKREWVVDQVWSNAELFATAYYAEKRPIYTKRMRAKKVVRDKWGYIMMRISRLFEEYEVTSAYAYNSSFDEKVLQFNCEWFKTQNPFEEIPIFDIRGYTHAGTVWSKEYQTFCETNQCFTESGNYSSTAETLFRFFNHNPEFEEEHTALADSEIELEILLKCIETGLKWDTVYKVYSSIPRKVQKTLQVISNGETMTFSYQQIRINKEKTKIVLK